MEKIIVFKDPVENQHGMRTASVASLLHRFSIKPVDTLPLINGIVCCLPQGLTEQQLTAAAGILAIEDNITVTLPPYDLERGWPFFGTPSKERQVTPWGVTRIGAKKVWSRTKGRRVQIAVLDSGIDIEHPDLAQNIKGGINILNPAQKPMDENGHGTHVAGTIAATDNNFGVVGVAPLAALYSVKILNRDGTGTLASLIKGLQWCVANRMRVVNLSIGTDANSIALRTAVQRVHRAGIVIVSAAGNEGSDNSIMYPAAYPEVVTVGAIDQRDRLTGFSSQGPELTVVAPGSGIYSTYLGDSYVKLSGTSMATPHVTGAIALLLNINPRLNPANIMGLLKNSSTNLPHLSVEAQGFGLINAQSLVENIL